MTNTNQVERCRECGFPSKSMHDVFEWGDSDGEPCKICDDCYDKHEEKCQCGQILVRSFP